MTTKKKDPRGRKEVPFLDQRVAVRIYVKRRHVKAATLEVAPVANKYR